MSGPTCTVCGRVKKPIGRDVGAAMGGDVCSWDCDGYLLEPKPPMDWPDAPARAEPPNRPVEPRRE